MSSLSEERKAYVEGLTEWQTEIAKKDATLKKNSHPVRSPNFPPVRPTAKIIASSKSIISTSVPHQPTNWEKALEFKEKGNASFKAGNFEEAIRHYTQSLELDQQGSVTLTNRAMAFLKLKKFKEAEVDCNQALELDDKNVKAWWRRGIARKELGLLKAAEADLQAALNLEQGNKAVQEELAKLKELLGEEGNLSFKNNDFEEAVKHYTRTLQKQEKNAHVLTNRAMAFIKLNRFKEAEADCSRALEIDSNNVKALWRRATARRNLGLLVEAHDDLQAALKIEPENQNLIDDLKKIKELTQKSGSKPTLPKSKPQQGDKKQTSKEPTKISVPKRSNQEVTKEAIKEISKESHKSNEKAEDLKQSSTDNKKQSSSASKVDPFQVISSSTAKNSDEKSTVSSDQIASKSPDQQSSSNYHEHKDESNEEQKSKADQKSNANQKRSREEIPKQPVKDVVIESSMFKEEPPKGIFKGEVVEKNMDAAQAKDQEKSDSETQKTRTHAEELEEKIPPKPNAEPVSNSNMPPAVKKVDTMPKAAPKSSFEFERDWKQLKGDVEKIYTYMKMIKPETLPKVMQEALNADMLAKIIEMVQKCYLERDSVPDTLHFLNLFSQVKRFDMNLKFLSKKQKEDIPFFFEKLEEKCKSQPATLEELQAIKLRFGVLQPKQ